MSDDAAADLIPYEAEDTLNRAGVKLTDGAARDTDGVMVMLRVRKRIARLAIDEAQLTDDACFQEELDSAEDGGTTDVWQITHQIFSSETVISLLEVLDDLPAG